MDRKFNSKRVARDIRSILDSNIPYNFTVIALKDRVHLVSGSGMLFSTHLLPIIAYLSAYGYDWFIMNEENTPTLKIY